MQEAGKETGLATICEVVSREAIEALSSVLWGYTSKDSLDMLEQFFPETKSPSGQSGK